MAGPHESILVDRLGHAFPIESKHPLTCGRPGDFMVEGKIVDTATVGYLKVLDPNQPIREADIGRISYCSSEVDIARHLFDMHQFDCRLCG
jgi:hypothetical protein